MNPEEKSLLARIFGNPNDGRVFRGIIEKRMAKLRDISTFKQFAFEDDTSIELIYLARRYVSYYIGELLDEISVREEPEEEKKRPRI